MTPKTLGGGFVGFFLATLALNLRLFHQFPKISLSQEAPAFRNKARLPRARARARTSPAAAEESVPQMIGRLSFLSVEVLATSFSSKSPASFSMLSPGLNEMLSIPCSTRNAVVMAG